MESRLFLFRVFSFFLPLILSLGSWAAPVVVSSSGEEVTYTYTAHVRTMFRVESQHLVEARELAQFHADHLFGLFHSAAYVERVGWPEELVEGFAGTKHPVIQEARFFSRPGDLYLSVEYSAAGEMIVLKDVLNSWIGPRRSSGTVELPLLADLSKIYTADVEDFIDKTLRECTDSHYTDAGDFSYFYAPYREGCERLRKAPLALETEFTIERREKPSEAPVVPLAKVRGANGNGKLSTLYFVFGFDGEPKGKRRLIRKDASWAQFTGLTEQLEKRGFKKMASLANLRETLGVDFNELTLWTDVTLTHFRNRTFFSTFVRDDGERKWVVRAALFNTKNDGDEEAPVSFPKFWKEAWENGDYIHFGGHAGSGQSLQIESMLDTLSPQDMGEIHFDKKKTQVAFFDACSSYAHYLDMYRELKPKNLHLMTYGLVSLFHLGQPTIQGVLDVILDAPEDVEWSAALRQIEEAQLEPHLRFLYADEDEIGKTLRDYRRREWVPSFLLNVSIE